MINNHSGKNVLAALLLLLFCDTGFSAAPLPYGRISYPGVVDWQGHYLGANGTNACQVWGNCGFGRPATPLVNDAVNRGLAATASLARFGDALNGGGLSFGTPTIPSNFQSNFQNPLFSGAGYQQATNAITGLLATLNDSSSSLNFGARIGSYYQSLMTPSFQSGFGFWRYSFGKGASTAAALRAYSSAGAAAPSEQTERLGRIASQWQDIARRQLEYYYTDAELSGIRADSNALILSLQFYDPWYVYWSRQFKTVLAQLQTSRRSYPVVASLAQEVASWTYPPDDIHALRERYNRRIALTTATAQLQAENRAAFADDPKLLWWVNEVSAFLNYRIAQVTGGKEFAQRQDDFVQRWKQASESSAVFRSLNTEVENLYRQNPGLEEYIEMHQELGRMTAQFADHPEVQSLATLLGQINTSPVVFSQIHRFHEEYLTELGHVIDSTNYKAVQEWFWEALNGTIQADPNYQILRDRAFQQVVALEQMQHQIAEAVARCMSRAGNACDPFKDVDVMRLLGSRELQQLIQGAGIFYELQNQYWYRFYTGDTYQRLEQGSFRSLQAELQRVASRVEAAQRKYLQAVDSVGELRQLRAGMERLPDILVHGNPALGGHLQKMSLLLKRLEEPSPGIDLAISRLTGPAAAVAGGRIPVEATAANQGTAAAGPFRVGYYFAPAGDMIRPLFSGWSCAFPNGLAAGATSTCRGDIGVPSTLQPGAYQLIAVIDDQNAVDETAEDNNSRPADTGIVQVRTQ